MLLLTGPPGSGKTTFVLEQIRRCLREDPSAVCLLLPTSTMADHLRNRLAREGFVLRKDTVTTLSRFLERCTSVMAEVPPAMLPLLVAECLAKATPTVFTALGEFPGFRDSLASVIDELASQGCTAGQFQELATTDVTRAIGLVYADLEALLAERGLALRGI